MPPSPGSRNRRPKTIAANSASVRNWRLRYAPAPSCTAWAMSCIFAVPSSAARTCLRSTTAKARATRAIAAMTATMVRLSVPSVSIRPP
ncbi:Uncharacterised protein [Mycobacteroides abscessus]|nr:Uncharacterised protein [Mycobacteroides abscessus]